MNCVLALRETGQKLSEVMDRLDGHKNDAREDITIHVPDAAGSGCSPYCSRVVRRFLSVRCPILTGILLVSILSYFMHVERMKPGSCPPGYIETDCTSYSGVHYPCRSPGYCIDRENGNPTVKGLLEMALGIVVPIVGLLLIFVFAAECRRTSYLITEDEPVALGA